MSGRGEDRRGESLWLWLRGALVVVVIAAALGVFSTRTGLQRPSLSALNLAGVALMLVGLSVSLLGNRIARGRAEAAPFVRLAGVLVCGVGAALVFI